MQHADKFGHLDHAKTLIRVENHVGKAKFFPRLPKTLVTLVCFGKYYLIYYLMLCTFHFPLNIYSTVISFLVSNPDTSN